MDWVRKQKWRSTLSTALNSDELQQMALQHDLEADRTVFIDNIPDDVDEDEVAKAFRRCGDVEKVSLYRPLHLDESKKEYQSGKKRRDFRYTPKGYSSAACSTNHGFVTFTGREGYTKANHETLRIFGVQLRDSMCRTRPTERCTALFVENPEGVTGEEMEASVNRALDPNFRVLLKKDDHMTTVPQVIKLPLNSYSACRVVELRLRSVGFSTAWCYYVPKVRERLSKDDMGFLNSGESGGGGYSGHRRGSSVQRGGVWNRGAPGDASRAGAELGRGSGGGSDGNPEGEVGGAGVVGRTESSHRSHIPSSS